MKAKAEQGDAAAQCEIGLSYSKGDGVELDEQEALKWYREAAEQKYRIAQYALEALGSGCGKLKNKQSENSLDNAIARW